MPFAQMDVFAEVPFGGNPVAVVFEADALTGSEMQRIAGWTNLFETPSALVPRDAPAANRLRIFTPRAELPFAGPPTIGSAPAVVEAGIARPRSRRLVQECGAGLRELFFDGGAIALKAPAPRPAAFSPARVPDLEKKPWRKSAKRARTVGLGPVWIVAGLADTDGVDALRPDFAATAALSDAVPATGVTVFGEAREGEAAVHVRSFAPAHGVPEDPVCGSGNISAAAYLRASGEAKRFGASCRAGQGMALGRVEIQFEAGDIFLAGRALTCVRGTLRVQ
ncbi:MAG: PhzF family phenazine biosynthesis protein [Burkholderiales bacterium]|nr:PhzF family phenazine biosynthesis protein [Burkholderiales bacterium]